jgi:aspartyl-tRNA(Asn)/glutamyl-tRNA(Gln) amidotransferase subunit C
LEISRDEVRRIARLARLGIGREEEDACARDLARILDWVRKISEVDVESVPAGARPAASGPPLREDLRSAGLEREAALRQAPDAAGGLFRVAAVLPARDPERSGR